MSLKSVFANKQFVNILFFLLIFIALITFVFELFSNERRFFIPFYKKVYANLIVNVEVDEKYRDDIRLFADTEEIEPTVFLKGSDYLNFLHAASPVWRLYLKTKNIDKIDNIVIFFGRNIYYFNQEDIKKFDKTSDGYYFFPKDVKYCKNSKFITDKGFYNAAFIKFLSIFYNTSFYIIPFVSIFLAVLIYLNNKDKINLNFTLYKNKAIWLILLVGTLLRIMDNNTPFWGDELYTSTVAANPNAPFIQTFCDPGNPPLFFILARIYQTIFGADEYVLRLLPCLFSIASIFLIYRFVKDNLDEKTALVASFCFSVNIYSILSAKEYRCYSLCIFFAILSAIYLFKIIKEKKTKDFVIYGIIASFMANTHYFQILILFSNFIWAMFFLNNKQRLKFFGANLVAVISFLPYFLYTGLNSGLLDKQFNTMPVFSLKNLWFIVIIFFSNPIVPITSIVVLVLLLIPKIRKFLFYEQKPLFKLFFFSLYTIFMLYFLAQVFSIAIKPIIKQWYFVTIIGFISILTASLLFMPLKNKIIKAFYVFFLLSFSLFSIRSKGIYDDRNDMLQIRIQEMLQYSKFDSTKYINNQKKTMIGIIDFIQYFDYYKAYISDKADIILYKFTERKPLVYKRIKEKNPDVIYMYVHRATVPEFYSIYKDAFRISLIQTDNGVTIARLVRR